MRRTEARILRTNNVLIAASKLGDEASLGDFCGSVLALDDGLPDLRGKAVYLCGDLSKARDLDLSPAARRFVIRDLSTGYDEGDGELVDLARVPILVHGIGVLYRRFFDPSADYFQRISAEHTFQSLTESTKPAKAHRTGIYLTPVTRQGDELRFHLLRCSTNLAGPTEGFRATDWHIVDALNQEAALVFEDRAPLNHVLAQIYHNTPAAPAQKQAKARISAHADKTKDMPVHGIMAFCTFYDGLDELTPMANDPWDRGYKGISGLTRLRFRLKETVLEGALGLPRELSLTLYPGSVFFMPLSTNRLYTHEIVAPALDAARLPTRLGYVVRCSKTEAVHKDGQTFLDRGGALVKLDPPTDEGMAALRALYAEENKSQAFIDYGDRFVFSMNGGDYLAPVYQAADEFRVHALPARDNLFELLRASIELEELGKGRHGAVLVEDDARRGTPIVRTTTRYGAPAQPFRAAHRRLAKQIQQAASLPMASNNALVEVYTHAYTTMGSHSDQALDLAEGSFIAIFSCYEHPHLPASRKLLVESKEPNGERFEIPLLHHRVVVLSLDTNRRFRHKIVLDASPRAPENRWLGVTFRTSKTHVRVRGGEAFFEDGTRLTLADAVEEREFFQLRRRENEQTSFTYPRITTTISQSDLMPVRG